MFGAFKKITTLFLVLSANISFQTESYSYTKCDFLRSNASGILFMAHPISEFSSSECYFDGNTHHLTIKYQGIAKFHSMTIGFSNNNHFMGLPRVENDSAFMPAFVATSELLKYITREDIDKLRQSNDALIKSVVFLYDNDQLLKSDYILYALLYLDWVGS